MQCQLPSHTSTCACFVASCQRLQIIVCGNAYIQIRECAYAQFIVLYTSTQFLLAESFMSAHSTNL